MTKLKYTKYIVTGDTERKANIMPGPSPEVVKMMEEERKAGNYIDRTIMFVILDAIVKGSFFAGCEWLWSLTGDGPVSIEIKHSHDFDEIIGFAGSNRNHPRDLGGEIEFWMEDEKLALTKTCLIFIPKGTQHCPIILKRIDTPIFMFEAGNDTVYEKLKQ